MEVTTALIALRVLVGLSALIALVWLVTRRAESAAAPSEQGLWDPLWAAPIGITVLGAILLILYRQEDGAVTWISFLSGGACLLLSSMLARLLERRAPDLPSASSLVSGLVFPLAFSLFLISRYSSRPVEWLAAAAAGAALFAAANCLALALSGRASAARQSAASLLAASAYSAIALSLVLGRLHFPAARISGEAVPTALAAALVIWTLQSLVPEPSGARPWVRAAIYLLLTAVILFALPGVLFIERPFVFCLLAGFAAGAIIAAIGSSVPEADLGTARAVIFAAAIGAGALSIRLLAGFGAVTCGAGMLAAAPIWALLANARAAESLRDRVPVGLLGMSATLVIYGVLRVWLEGQPTVAIYLGNPYAFIGLAAAVGGVSLACSSLSSERETSNAALPAFLWTAAAGIGVVLAAVVLREPALRLLIAGAGAAALGVTVSGAPRAARLAAVSLALAIATSMAAAAPGLMDVSAELSRTERATYVAVGSLLLVLIFLVLEVRLHRSAAPADQD